jgi:hypothetical protein
MLESFYTYLYLGLSDEEMMMSFLEFLKKILPDNTAFGFLNLLMISEHAKKAGVEGKMFSESKTLDLCCENLMPVIEARVELKIKTKMDTYVEKIVKEKGDAALTHRYEKLRTVGPIMYQFGQENIFLGKPILNTTSFLLSRAAMQLRQKGFIRHTDEMHRYNFMEICMLLSGA